MKLIVCSLIQSILNKPYNKTNTKCISFNGMSNTWLLISEHVYSERRQMAHGMSVYQSWYFHLHVKGMWFSRKKASMHLVCLKPCSPLWKLPGNRCSQTILTYTYSWHSNNNDHNQYCLSITQHHITCRNVLLSSYVHPFSKTRHNKCSSIKIMCLKCNICLKYKYYLLFLSFTYKLHFSSPLWLCKRNLLGIFSKWTELLLAFN